MDFLDLRLRVSDLIGNRTISDAFPFLTTQAETVLNRRLRTMWHIEEFSPVWAGNEADLPPDFLQLVHTDDQLKVRAGKLYRKPHYTRPSEIEYYAKLPTITTGPDGTNWLLGMFPSAYVYATGVEAAKHLRLAEIGLATQELLDAEISAIKIEDDRARYSHHAVKVRGCTP